LPTHDSWPKQEELELKVNRLRHEREKRMLSKIELARKAGVAVQTLIRIEKGGECRLQTKGKLLAALGLSVGEKERVFPEG
jgi:DNA-binding XRE family transcriptional regulator